MFLRANNRTDGRTDGRTDRRTDGRTAPYHNMSKDGRIKNQKRKSTMRFNIDLQHTWPHSPQHLQCSAPMNSNSVPTTYYGDVTMGAIASQITSVSNVYSTVCSGTDQRKHQSSASLAFVRGIHRGPVNSPHKRSVTRKIFPLDDIIMQRIYDVHKEVSVRRICPWNLRMSSAKSNA